MNTLFYLAILTIAGLLFGRIVKQFRLPNVTGYLLAGLIMGPYVLNFVSSDVVNNLDVISDIALAFIAFTIGCEFKISYFKRVGLMPVVIALFEALLAVFFVQAALIIAGFDISFSLVLGAIAAATAPAATVMVIKQYRAKGPVTETLMSVVAIDDAVALITFGFAVEIAKTIGNNYESFNVMMVLKPFLEIGISFLIGGIIGILFKIFLKYFKRKSNRMIIITGMVFLSSGLSTLLGASTLLTCMATGAVFCNISIESDEITELLDYLTPPIFLLFFVVSGAQLDITLIPYLGIVGVIYVVFRVIGKILGAYVGAKIMNAPKEVCRYLGPALIPQAGVAIGLISVTQEVIPEFAPKVRAIILCATLIYEIIGPIAAKYTLVKAGEIVEA